MKKVSTMIIVILLILTAIIVYYDSEKEIIDEGEEGNVKKEIIWSSDKVINDNFTVNSTDVLIINPGVTVYLSESSRIDVYGIIEANGTSNHWIKFINIGKPERTIIQIWNSPKGLFNYCEISNGLMGIFVRNSGNITIKNSKIYNNSRGGLSLYYSDNCQILNNEIFNNDGFGIEMVCSSNNRILENKIYSQRDGIQMVSTFNENNNDNNVINGNNISYNSRGINDVGGFDNLITNNTFKENSDMGIYIIAPDNRLYHNNFISNKRHINYLTPGIHADQDWDNGNGEGNYWDNYDGFDINRDGIGDTKLPHLDADYYPFMEENGWLK